MNCINKIFSLIFFLLNSSFLFPQQYNFSNYSIKDGLPQSTVYKVLQDKRGYLWLGTNGGGAARFDGKNFKVYNKKNGLAGNVVRSLFQDSKGNIWFGTDEGITIYDGNKFFSLTKEDSLKGKSVLCFAEKENGKIFTGTDDGGLNVIELLADKKVKISNYSQDDGLVSPAIFDILIDGDRIWLATLYGGINILSEKKGSFSNGKIIYDISTLRLGQIPSDAVLCLAKDEGGNIWGGTYDAGIFKIDSENKITHFQNKDGFSSNSVWDILFANDKSLWFATGEQGMIHFANNKFYTYNTKNGLPNNQLSCVMQDTEGNIWMGTNGDGLCRFGGEHFLHYTLKEGLSNDNIQGISQDESGAIWLATNGGGVMKMDLSGEKYSIKKFTEQNGFISNSTAAMTYGKFKNNNLWIATVNKGVVKFDGKKFTSFTESNGLQDNRVNSILVDNKGIVWCGTANGISRYDGLKFLNASMEKMKMSDEGVKIIIEDMNENIWFGTAGGLAKYGGDGSLTTYDEMEGLSNKDVNTITPDVDGNIWIGTKEGGIFKYETHSKDSMPIRFVADDSLLSSNSINAMIFIDEKNLLVGTNKGIDKISLENNSIKKVRNYNASDGFHGVEVNDNAFFKDKQNNIWIGTIAGLTKYTPGKENTLSYPPQVHITNLQLEYNDVNWAEKKFQVSPWFNLPLNLELSYKENNLTFHFTGISLSNPEKIKFTTFLEGQDKNWTPLSSESKITYPALNPDNYTFKVKAVNAEGIWSKEINYTFTVLPPWYKTTTFYISFVVFLVIGIIVFIKYRERKLIEEKKILEQKVKERTEEVVKQKEEIEEQKELIEEKNKDITDSINYAQRIQHAILPNTDEMKKVFPQSFILFKPKDIVSGDFYWMHEKNGKVLFMAADCTGHGVPGAFMSMIGSSLLNQIVGEKNILMPDKILNQLRIEIMKALKQTGAEGESKDGMDASLCMYDKANHKLYFSAANNPMYLIRKNETGNYEFTEVKADKQPIGYNPEQNPFTLHEFSIEQSDTVYLFSDGYEDQFGGPKGKKFMSKKFKEILLSMQEKNMDEQFSLVNLAIENWKNHEGKIYEQIDDILVIGVRF